MSFLSFKKHTPRWQRIVWNRTMGAVMLVDGVCLIIAGRSPGLDLRFAAWEIKAAMREKKYEYSDPAKEYRKEQEFPP